MVGWAMNASFSEDEAAPAHRVVNSQRLLTGKMHLEFPTQMEELLNKEGIPVKNDQIQDFHAYFWDPAKELSLD